MQEKSLKKSLKRNNERFDEEKKLFTNISELTFQSLFAGSIYKIPAYQRAYV